MSMGPWNAKAFFERYAYAIEQELTSTPGVAPTWAPGHPQEWGQEKAAVRLGQDSHSTPALSPDDRLLAVGVGEDVHIYEVATQELVQVLKGHSGTVEAVQFSGATYDHGYLLASDSQAPIPDDILGGTTSAAILWHLDRHGKPLSPIVEEAGTGGVPADANLRFEGGELGRYGSSPFSPDGKTLVFLRGNQTTQYDEEEGRSRDAASLPSVTLWSLEGRAARQQLRGHTDAIQWIAASPDSSRVASAAWDGTARIWDAATGALLRVLGPWNEDGANPHGGQLWAGAWSPDGSHLAVARGDPTARAYVCEIATGRTASSVDFGVQARSLAWSPDGRTVACGGGGATLVLWDPYTGREQMRWCLAFGHDVRMGRISSVRAVRFLNARGRGAKIIFQVNCGTVHVYDLETNEKYQFAKRAEDMPDSFPRAEPACSTRLVVVPGSEGVLRLWDL
ncbi:WD40-repeat-containing domain protein [Lasiosphaeria hispida]|uniref:WD40-repeat-containing domain protein n=1 Tax=Lasiosphaeria hispida TaxID=260671 RepID=A0AAJ0MGM4_9PEZI|nr:WD40-repeat-containing domain protein [Lasiosphaeria hispida]